MDRKQILDGNALIASYMGASNMGDMNDTILFSYAHVPTPSLCGLKTISTGEMKYHSSWDWLIPVVVKMNLDFENDDLRIISDEVITLLYVEILFESVVEFLKTYYK